jgi:hypothetical protein
MFAIAQTFDSKYHTRIAGSIQPAKKFFATQLGGKVLCLFLTLR